MLDRLIPQEDEDAAKELAKAFRKKGIALELGKQCTGVEETGGALTVRYGDGESVEADLMLVSVGRAPLVSGIGLEAAGVAFDTRKGIGADDHRRTSRAAHLRGRRLRRLLAARAHRLPRGRGRGRERLRPRRRRRRTAPCRGRSTPTPRSPASA